MKRLLNTSDVIGAWADQDRAAGGGGPLRVSFDGPRLFSYATPIAAIVQRTVDAHAPLRICLTTYRRHSVTTSGHISQARSAAAQAGLTSIAVASIDAPLDHQRNMLGISEDAVSHLRRALRARQYAESHAARARKRVLELNVYAKFYGLGFHVAPDMEHLQYRLEDLIGTLQSLEAVVN